MDQHIEPKTISFEQLADLRGKTERLSKFLTQRLKTHMSALSPILAPRRIFGRHVGGKEAVVRADEAYTQLLQKYREVSGAPFDLKSELGEEGISGMENTIEVYPWEYTHEVAGNAVTITSPVRWAVTYESDYSLPDVRAVVRGPSSDRRPQFLRRFVVNALAMQVVLARSPRAVQLLEDLRYDVQVETPVPGLGKLPLVTISSRIGSFRPSDDAILAGTRLSGVAAFIELIDPEVVYQLHDPLREQLEIVIGQNSTA